MSEAQDFELLIKALLERVKSERLEREAAGYSDPDFEAAAALIRELDRDRVEH